jgi:uncharacterized membrane protein
MGGDSSGGGVFYIPLSRVFFFILIAVLVIISLPLIIGTIGVAFRRVFPGLGLFGVLILLTACLVGSVVNIPLFRVQTEEPMLYLRYVTVFGVTYPVPTLGRSVSHTQIAVNLGGAIIPVIASLYVLVMIPSVIPQAVIATAIVTIVVHRVARPVKGLGITTPALLPPLITAITAVLVSTLFGGEAVYAVAYVAGTLGTLIGADLLNLKTIPKLGAPIASIGGAGTFDGVFLTGIIAVLLA